MNCIHCGNWIDEFEPSVDAGEGAVAHKSCYDKSRSERLAKMDAEALLELLDAKLMDGNEFPVNSVAREVIREFFGKPQRDPSWPDNYPVSAPETESLNNIAREHSKVTGFWRSGGLSAQIRGVIENYHHRTKESIELQKQFRDEMIIWFRAFSMILTGIGNGATHREKEARLRMAVEMVESSISKLREQVFEIGYGARGFPDIFQSEYPVRGYLDKIHELEEKLKALGSPEPTTVPDEAPF